MPVKKVEKLGLMGSNPDTGECVAVFGVNPVRSELAELMAQGLIFQRRPMHEVKDAFSETHPSRRVIARGNAIGSYLDADISAWIETADGIRYQYAHVCGPVVDFDRLTPSQIALAPGIVFERTP